MPLGPPPQSVRRAAGRHRHRVQPVPRRARPRGAHARLQGRPFHALRGLRHCYFGGGRRGSGGQRCGIFVVGAFYAGVPSRAHEVLQSAERSHEVQRLCQGFGIGASFLRLQVMQVNTVRALREQQERQWEQQRRRRRQSIELQRRTRPQGLLRAAGRGHGVHGLRRRHGRWRPLLWLQALPGPRLWELLLPGMTTGASALAREGLLPVFYTMAIPQHATCQTVHFFWGGLPVVGNAKAPMRTTTETRANHPPPAPV